MQESSTTFIYCLRDPRTDAVRYVGKANDPLHRSRMHPVKAREGGGCHRATWLRELDRLGLRPILCILEECERTGWQDRERWWIAHYRALGCDLVNTTDGGDGSEGHRPSQATRAKLSASQTGRQVSPAVRAKIAEGNAKEYILLSPDGEEIRVINLLAFCRERGLSRSNLAAVLSGRYRQSQGWRIRRAEDPPFEPMRESRKGVRGKPMSEEHRAAISAHRSLKFIATTPDGEEIRGANLVAFCKERGLGLKSMRAVLKGEKEHIWGWRIRRLENDES